MHTPRRIVASPTSALLVQPPGQEMAGCVRVVRGALLAPCSSFLRVQARALSTQSKPPKLDYFEELKAVFSQERRAARQKKMCGAAAWWGC